MPTDFNDDQSSQSDPKRIWLGGLPAKVTEYAVLQLVKQFGPLADFRFPIHQGGNLKGSTVGYCFVTYKFRKDAERACKCLNRLNFHHSHLVARPSRQSKDELSLAKRSAEEAAKLRILKEAELNKARLSAIINGEDVCTEKLNNLNEHEILKATAGCSSSCDDQLLNVAGGGRLFNLVNLPDSVNGCQHGGVVKDQANVKCTDSARIENTIKGTVYHTTSNGNVSTATTTTTSTAATTAPTLRHKTTLSDASKAAAIRLIEAELKKLRQNPVGGSASLQPAQFNRSDNPVNILNRHKAAGTTTNDYRHKNHNSHKRSMVIVNRYRHHQQHQGSRKYTKF